LLNLDSLPNELIVAVLVAFASFLWIRSSTVLQRWYLRRKYGVRGEYISYYEETHDGVVCWGKAVLDVRQKGLFITAKSMDARQTVFSAEVTKTRTITGTYHAGRPTAVSAKGTLFLEPDPNATDVYRGFYAGYDFALRGLMSGRYVWRRLYQPSIGRPSQKPQDKLRVRTFLTKYLDSRYLSAALVENALQPKRHSSVVTAAIGRILVGAVVVDSDPGDDLADILGHVGNTGGIQNVEAQKFGLVRGAAVSAQHRMRGIGTTLTRAAMSHLRDRSCTAIICVEWMPDRDTEEPGRRPYPPPGIDWAVQSPTHDAPPLLIPGRMEGLLKTEGFDLIGKVTNRPTPVGGCALCGPSCICVGWVFARSLDG
jgi:hypothetical protein